jgi:hypothetical protein
MVDKGIHSSFTKINHLLADGDTSRIEGREALG